MVQTDYNMGKLTQRNLWPVAIMAFFAIAIAAAVSFVVFCQMNNTDLVARDYYEQEIRHEAQMQRALRTQQLPEQPAIRYDAGARVIHVILSAEHAAAGSRGVIHLYRPSEAGMDRKVELTLDARGAQAIDASGLVPGLWTVKVSWTAGGLDYYVDRKLQISS